MPIARFLKQLARSEMSVSTDLSTLVCTSTQYLNRSLSHTILCMLSGKVLSHTIITVPLPLQRLYSACLAQVSILTKKGAVSGVLMAQSLARTGTILDPLLCHRRT